MSLLFVLKTTGGQRAQKKDVRQFGKQVYKQHCGSSQESLLRPFTWSAAPGSCSCLGLDPDCSLGPGTHVDAQAERHAAVDEQTAELQPYHLARAISEVLCHWRPYSGFCLIWRVSPTTAQPSFGQQTCVLIVIMRALTYFVAMHLLQQSFLLAAHLPGERLA